MYLSVRSVPGSVCGLGLGRSVRPPVVSSCRDRGADLAHFLVACSPLLCSGALRGVDWVGVCCELNAARSPCRVLVRLAAGIG
jgi:hypothetical protein